MENKTLEFFKTIASIPRESGNEKEISNFLCEFAKERKLWYEQDKYNNVIIKKKDGRNNPIILQAHMDMVCEKDSNLEFDFTKDKINIYKENGYLKAKGTTLGADNGIGIAQILNILDSDLKINIEAIFTVSEETTMIGAEKIDISKLEGKQMINLDGFEENVIITESASFFDIIIKMKYDSYKIYTEKLYKVTLSGMEGGHSGYEIDNEKGNSIIELVKLLSQIRDIKISNFKGGTKFNVIPSKAECEFYSKENLETLKEIVKTYENSERKKFAELSITLCEIKEKKDAISESESKEFLKSIESFKHGVLHRTADQKVTTSENLGVVDLRENIIKVGVRSSRKNEEKEILEYLQEYSKQHNFKFQILGSQPGFTTKENSALIQNLMKSFKKVNEKENIELKPVHVTVEAGFFKNKIPELEVAIISPKIIGAHTIKERVEIKSVEKCDKWLIEFLTNN